MSKSFLEGFLFRPQGKPMIHPYAYAAKISQFPYRFAWNESFFFRYIAYSWLIVLPIYWKIDKFLLGPENDAYWREKRKSDYEHHHKELVKKWETKT